MHLPLAHQARLAGQFEDDNEEIHAQLHANSGSHSHDDDGSQSQGSKGSGGGVGADGNDGSLTKPPKDLPCPRCQSMNTKFCYYNNYSVNQPRHFCRNCQRYWTVGGTLRNVPVGGGSRKKTRTRSRSDPYYRAGNVNSPAQDHSSDVETEAPMHPAMAMESMEAMAAMAAVVGMAGPEMAGLDSPLGGFGEAMPDFPFHPSQLSALLQLTLMQNAGMYSPFMDRPQFPVGTPDEEADFQALYEAQSGFLSSAAAMMFMPQLEPAHLDLMHKATLWAETQRFQVAAARRQSQAQVASAWASSAEERECKPQQATAQMPHRHHAAMEELLQRQQAVAGRHSRPGFWETALMHSRPRKRVPGWSDSKPSAATHGSASTVEEEAGNPVSGSYSHGGYDDSSSWGSGLPAASDLYYP